MIETRRLSRRHSVPEPPALVTCLPAATVGICIKVQVEPIAAINPAW